MKNKPSITIFSILRLLFTAMLFWSASASMSAQIALNMELQANWDDNTITNISGVVFNDIWGYVDDNSREYALIGSTQYTHFIDVTDPKNPVEIQRVAGNSNSLWRDIKTYGHYAYSVADQGAATLQIFDLSDLPNSVTKVYDSNEFFAQSHNIFIDEPNARLYSVGTDVDDVVILDLSVSPDNPTLLKNIDLGEGYIHDMYVRGNIGYASHIYSSKLFVYDFSDVNNPSILGSLTSYSNKGLNHSNWVSEAGNILVLADETKDKAVKIIDVSDLSDIKEISVFKSTLEGPTYTNSIAHNPFIYGNDYVFVSYYHDGIQLFDISDPENPFQAAYFDTYSANTNYSGSKGCWGVYPYLPSGNIIASDMTNGLFVVRTTFPLQDCENDVLVKGNYKNEWSFSANSSIVSDATIEAGGKMTFQAPNKIELQPGFKSENGSLLQTDLLDACNEVAAVNVFDKNEESAAKMEERVEENNVFQLQVSPNPFQDISYVEYFIPQTNTNVLLEIYDFSGKKMQTLVKTNRHKSGTFKMLIDGRNLVAGLYYCVFRVGEYQMIKKLVKN